MKEGIILAIETSCDETSAAVVTTDRKILSNTLHSQEDLHSKYGGVIPELASREHILRIDEITKSAIQNSGINLNDITAIACTYTPGLIGSLLIGISYAKGLALSLNKPLIGVDHVKAHLRSYEIEFTDPQYPIVGLVVSGGHTLLYIIKDDFEESLLGTTLDDAAGEALDKIAKLLGFGYPGGPVIDRISKPLPQKLIQFPSVKTKSEYDFSFSGLKTYALYLLKGQDMRGKERELNEDELKTLCASFQECVVDELLSRIKRAVSDTNVNSVAITGGVAANSRLRDKIGQYCQKNRLNLYIPSVKYCTDNAAMVANYAIKLYERDLFSPLDLDAIPTKKYEHSHR
ncbi:MAG: tRNA (adenosine(37)-N6)-threonylcarbamoyltransferase complex transferase subunit TsaD [Planctomycetes bacterium]|nr:tRNA (adenosine(37)-N6)-threonylcarbamoyltransferase complex transferase subunit TsaD [Planctomycetota bacterium]